VSKEAAEKAQNKAKKWDRYHVERRALTQLRKGIHGSTLGKLLTKVRFYCDVMLRE
jgi:acetylornithine/succinyldiaminopimelate/putrescine aminotransferase